MAVVLVFVASGVLGALAFLAGQPVVGWVICGLGNTVVFFMVLFLVVRAASRR